MHPLILALCFRDPDALSCTYALYADLCGGYGAGSTRFAPEEPAYAGPFAEVPPDLDLHLH